MIAKTGALAGQLWVQRFDRGSEEPGLAQSVAVSAERGKVVHRLQRHRCEALDRPIYQAGDRDDEARSVAVSRGQGMVFVNGRPADARACGLHRMKPGGAPCLC